MVDDVILGRVQGVQTQEHEDHDQRDEPGMRRSIAFPHLHSGARFPRGETILFCMAVGLDRLGLSGS